MAEPEHTLRRVADDVQEAIVFSNVEENGC